MFAPFVLEKKMQNLLDYKYDIYQNVDQIKYYDKHPSSKEITAIHKDRMNKLSFERRKIWKELGL